MKFFDIPNFSILYKLKEKAKILALSKPKNSLSLIYIILWFISGYGFKKLTFLFGRTIKIFLNQGIYLNILLKENLNS